MLVMEPGGYTFGDYVKIGLPLLLLTMQIAIAPLARNRKFESISLQRGVCCEPDPVDQGAELQLASHRRISESGFNH